MITRFRVQNYKALRDVTLDLTPMHLLIGPNDSGKTSLLEAIAALCRSVDQKNTVTAFIGTWLDESLVWHGAQTPEVCIEVTCQHPEGLFEYRFDVKFQRGRSVMVTRERIDVPWLEDSLDARGGASPRSVVSLRAGQNFQSGTKDGSDELSRVVHEALSGVHFYRWVPQHLSIPVAPDSQRRFRMEPSGCGLALCLDDILGFDRDRFIRLEKRFCEVFPQVESIKLVPEPAYKAPVDDSKQILMLQQSEGKGIYFKFVGDEKLVSASQVSDGVLLVLAYLAVLYLPEPPRVVLVEEPENGIHPARLKEVLTILRDLVSEQSHTQIVLTSHSPYVVSLFEPNEVTLCHKGEDGAVQVRRLSESKSVQEQVDFFTLGEIWTLEGDEALLESGREAPSAP